MHTLEVVPRYRKLMREFDGRHGFARQDFWIERPVSAVLDDFAGETPGDDWGIVGLNFVTAVHFEPIGP